MLHAAGNDCFGFFNHFLRLFALLGKIFILIFFKGFSADRIDWLFDERVQLSCKHGCIRILCDGESCIHL